MLVLKRMVDQSLIIQVPVPGGGVRIVKVQVTEIRSDNVRLGTTADEDIIIDREEVYRDKALVRARESKGLPG